MNSCLCKCGNERQSAGPVVVNSTTIVLQERTGKGVEGLTSSVFVRPQVSGSKGTNVQALSLGKPFYIRLSEKRPGHPTAVSAGSALDPGGILPGIVGEPWSRFC